MNFMLMEQDERAVTNKLSSKMSDCNNRDRNSKIEVQILIKIFLHWAILFKDRIKRNKFWEKWFVKSKTPVQTAS